MLQRAVICCVVTVQSTPASAARLQAYCAAGVLLLLCQLLSTAISRAAIQWHKKQICYTLQMICQAQREPCKATRTVNAERTTTQFEGSDSHSDLKPEACH
jgi:hypothetical protein